MEFTQCPLCASFEIKKKKGTHEFKFKDKLITTPIVEYWYCEHCGESFFDHQANKIIDENLRLKRSRSRAKVTS